MILPQFKPNELRFFAEIIRSLMGLITYMISFVSIVETPHDLVAFCSLNLQYFESKALPLRMLDPSSTNPWPKA